MRSELKLWLAFSVFAMLVFAVVVSAGDVPALKPLPKLATTNEVPGLKLTPAQTAAPGQRVVVVVAVAHGSVKWDVKGGTGAAEIDGKNLLVFFKGEPEVITVRAVTIVSTKQDGDFFSSNGPSDTATTTITVPGLSGTKPVMPTPFKLLKDKAKAKTELVPIEEK